MKNTVSSQSHDSRTLIQVLTLHLQQVAIWAYDSPNSESSRFTNVFHENHVVTFKLGQCVIVLISITC